MRRAFQPETSTHPLDQALNPQPQPRGTLSLDHPDNYVEPINNLDGPDYSTTPVSDVPFIINQGDYHDGGGNNNDSQNNNDENNNDENGQNNYESFWDFDFSDDDTEDECTVPYDCGDEDNDDDDNGSGLPDEENSTEGDNG